MNRREMLLSSAAGLAAAAVSAPERLAAAAPAPRTRLGVVIHSFVFRPRLDREAGRSAPFGDPLSFLEYCHQLGAGGIQVGLGVKDDAYAARLRRQAETHGMFVEGSAGLPRGPDDVERFAAEVRTAQQAGATVIRTVMMPGRRYEQFEAADRFRQTADRARQSLELAEPVVRRQGMRLAVENHKDWRVPEMLQIIQRIASQHVGICVDTGNSIALLEDPMEVVRAYAPWAMSVHLKDMAVREYEQGFLLSEVPLGEGFLDLLQMVKTLRQSRADIRFALEMITRDPLAVPCLTEKYWATLGEVPGRDLARTLRLVRAKAAQELPRVSHLPFAQQVAREEENVRRCLRYAAERLGV